MLLEKSIYQIIIGAVAVYSMVRGSYKFFNREKNQTPFKFIFVVMVWGGILVFSLFPELTHSISKRFGFGDNLNTLIFIGFVVVFMVLFKMLNIIEKLESNISEIVRKEALSKLKDKIDE